MSATSLTTTRSRVAFFIGLVLALSLLSPLPQRAEATHGECKLDVFGDQGFTPSTGDPTGDIDSHNVGEAHTMTARLITPGGEELCVPTANVNIDFENENGANDSDGTTYQSPDLTCTINAGSLTAQCEAGYTGTRTGSDTWRTWIDHDGVQTSTEADRAEGLNEATQPGDGGTNCTSLGLEPEPDCTDVTRADWGGGPFAAIDCDDANPPDTEREANPTGAGSSSDEPYTCRAFHAAGGLTAGSTSDTNDLLRIYAEVENGVNDPDPADGQSYREPDYSCDVPETGDTRGLCVINVSQVENEAGTAEICFWGFYSADSTNPNPASPGGPGEEGERQCTGASPPRAVGDQGAEPTGEAQQPDLSDPANDPADQVELSWGQRVANQVDAEPEVQTLPVGSTANVTATIFDQFGTTLDAPNRIVKFEFFDRGPTDRDGNSPQTPDATCNPNASNNCTISFQNAPPIVGVDLICAWIGNDPVMNGNNTGGTCDNEQLHDPDDDIGTSDGQGQDDDQDVVQVQWQDAAAASRIDCSPETFSTLPGSSHTVTCSATNLQGTTVANTPIDAEATGANDPDNQNSPLAPDFSCITGGDGSCTFTHGPTGTSQSGITTYRAWIDSDNNNGSVEADQGEARDEIATPGITAEPDNTDVVDKTWGGQPSALTITPKSDTAQIGSCNAYTVKVTDVNGQGLAGVTIDVEQRHERADNSTANDEPTVSFCTPTGSDGANPTLVDAGRGDLRQPDENPDNLGTAGGETTGSTDGSGQITFGISVAAGQGSNGSGTVNLRVWHESTDNDDPDSAELQDTATKSWSVTGSPSPSQSTTGSTSPGGPGTRNVTLTASRNKIRYNQSVSLNGRVEAPATTPPSCTQNVTVTIQHDPFGGASSFVDLTSATTTSTGAFSVNIQPDVSANYVAKVVEGSPAGCSAATSTTETVQVRMLVSLKASRARVAKGSRVTLRSKLTPCPGHEGDTIVLRRKNAGQRSFRKAAQVRTNSSCVAKFRGRLRKTASFKAVWPQQDEQFLRGKSRTVRVRVRG